jgi:hypothetical protein
MTRYGAAGTDTRRVLVPSCPKGWGGTAPSPSLALLAVAYGYACASLRSAVSQNYHLAESDAKAARLVAPPRRAPRPKAVVGCGAPNVARPTPSTPF